MKRYNQGFGYFGPMEQADDGEWCRVKDVEKKIRELDAKRRKEKLKLMITYSKKVLYKSEEADDYKTLMWASIAVNIGLIAGFVITEYLI